MRRSFSFASQPQGWQFFAEFFMRQKKAPDKASAHRGSVKSRMAQHLQSALQAARASTDFTRKLCTDDRTSMRLGLRYEFYSGNRPRELDGTIGS
jgi:hypothetical protein